MTSVAPIVLGGRYRLGDLLGSGGMARVFRARDTVLGRDVAIKVFRQDDAIPDADARYGGEVRLLAGLSHPGLVMVFDAGRDDADPLSPVSYLVMELVDGTTLARELDAGPIDARRTAAIGTQLASALAYVHARGVVHRDIKPANVLMGPSGSDVAKLTDFGVARFLDSTRLTMHGTTVGTANYLSPEQTTGAEVGPASDVYSLGLVLLECLTGAVAFPGQGVAAAVARLHRDPQLPTWLDPSWRQLLAAMTARAAGDRPSAGEVAARLGSLPTSAHASGHASASASAGGDTAATQVVAAMPGPAMPGEPARDGRRPRRIAWASAALVAAAALAATAAATTRDAARPAAASADLSAYPRVAGALGSDLRSLELLAPAALRPGVADVARRGAARDYHGAQSALSEVLDRLAALRAHGQVSDTLNAKIAIAIARVSSDLLRAQLAADAAARAASRQAERARELAAARAAQARADREAQAAARAAARSAAAAARRAAAAQMAAHPTGPGSAHHGGHHPPRPAPGPGDGPAAKHGPGHHHGPGDH